MAAEKTECPVVIYTRHHRVEGTMALLKGERFSDKLNAPNRQFESIGDARRVAGPAISRRKGG